ncbi:hypothetical protein [Pseudonocardia sp. T1-2H]|uniref:hypothetical protein n=1 Tax=Pseudonocardia sp. T1-2H TaxID=3128899 RepID=UPI003100DB12
MSAAARTCRYSLNQAVEVLHADFETPDFPDTWFAGVVEKIEVADEARGLWTVTVRRGERAWSLQIVGPRGGNKRIRPAENGAVVPLDAQGFHGNQCAAKAYQRFYFDADPQGARYWVDMGERIDPDQAPRWAKLRETYGGPCDPAAPEAAPARDDRRGVEV